MPPPPFPPGIKDIDRFLIPLGEADLNAYHSQLLTEKSILYRKFGARDDAISTAIQADQLVQDHNVDAVNNISSTLRKYIAVSIDSNDCIRQRIDDIRREVFGAGGDGLLKHIQTYAEQGNLYALREYIRWHIDYCINSGNPYLDEVIFGTENAGRRRPQDILTHLGCGLDSILRSYQSKPVPAGNGGHTYTVKDIWNQINRLLELTARFPAPLPQEVSKPNLQLLFLRGYFEYEFQCYDNAIQTMEEVCRRKEAAYIRRGTLGLKARYLLARSHMAKADFCRALPILAMIREELQTAQSVRESQEGTRQNEIELSLDAGQDFRVERDYGYCLMQLGNYRQALDVYVAIDRERLYESYSPLQKVMNFNNHLSCLLHTGAMADARLLLHRHLDGQHDDPETNLLRGYIAVCDEAYPHAQTYFDKAYSFGQDPALAFPGLLDFEDAELHPCPNQAIIRNLVERRSAYLINLIQLDHRQEGAAEQGAIRERICSFLRDLPASCMLSMKAMIALGRWLVEQERALQQTLAQYGEEEQRRLLQAQDSLFRAFAAAPLYPERGARAFEEFRASPDFHYFQSAERGRILAHLFAMYQGIKAIKEDRCFSREDLEKARGSLVHYTNLKTLKILLSDQPAEGRRPPRFRVSNCGYMNDMFEGTAFLDAMRAKVLQENLAPEEAWISLIKNYFPHMIRSEENMIPIGKNVYIACLSLKKDSFPIWSIYSEGESGCNLSFGEDFFDVRDKVTCQKPLRAYLISPFTDADYPLYSIRYLDTSRLDPFSDAAGEAPWEPQAGWEQGEQDLLLHIFSAWKGLNDQIGALRKKYFLCAQGAPRSNDAAQAAIDSILSFAADRINEVRFLYKDEDYRYESEVRVVVTTSRNSWIDENLSPPRTYTEVDRPIENVSVCLGSKIDDTTADQYVTWLKQTGKVREVKLSKRNRRTRDRLLY